MEFTVAFLNLSKSLVTLLEEIDLAPKTANRKGYNIVYFKDSEAIEDCLYIMGASTSMFDMMNVEIVKDFRNKANRAANCETANIERTVKASWEQSAAIEKIEEKKGLDFLKPDLKEMAVLRQDNPEASLAELSKLSGLSSQGRSAGHQGLCAGRFRQGVQPVYGPADRRRAQDPGRWLPNQFL